MNKQKGFTLIELMISVAIVGILGAVAIPQYNGYVSTSASAACTTELNLIRSAFVAADLDGTLDATPTLAEINSQARSCVDVALVNSSSVQSISVDTPVLSVIGAPITITQLLGATGWGCLVYPDGGTGSISAEDQALLGDAPKGCAYAGAAVVPPVT